MRRHGRVAAVAGATTTAVVAGTGGLAYMQARLLAAQPDVHVHRLDGRVNPRPGVPLRRVVWLGDSLASGVGAASPHVSLPHLVAVGTDHPTRLHVFATPGATSFDVVHHQLPLLEQLRHGLAGIGQRIDAVGVTVGGNDIAALTTRRHFRHNIGYIVASATGTPVVLVSIPHLADAIRLPRPLRTFASWRAHWLDRVLQGVARTHEGVHYASVRRRPAWIGRQDLHNFLALDRYHPSGAGYAIWADTVAEAFDMALTPAH